MLARLSTSAVRQADAGRPPARAVAASHSAAASRSVVSRQQRTATPKRELRAAARTCWVGCSGTGRVQSQVGAAGAPSVEEVKAQLVKALEGTERGIFGVPAAKRAEVEELVTALEGINPTPAPLADPACVEGEWEVLFSTIKITGAKRTKLGLREFVKISDLLQIIDTDARTAVNLVRFKVMGLGDFSGSLRILASYREASETRVNIEFQESTLEPPQLQKIFAKNYDLLLAIFNPQGWLEVTYVDGEHRVGRDDKDNFFILARK